MVEVIFFVKLSRNCYFENIKDVQIIQLTFNTICVKLKPHYGHV